MTDQKFEMHGARVRNTDIGETGVLITTKVRSPAGMEFPGFNDAGEYRVPVRLDDGGLAFFRPEHLEPEQGDGRPLGQYPPNPRIDPDDDDPTWTEATETASIILRHARERATQELLEASADALGQLAKALRATARKIGRL